MSVTKGFEEKEIRFYGEDTVHYNEDDVLPLLAHARALETMLKKHEWAEYEGAYYCPECLGLRDDGHKTDCQLAKALEGV